MALFPLPIGILRMLQVPEGTAAAHHWQLLEVVFRGRRAGGPLQSPSIPGIVARGLSAQGGTNDVIDEAEDSSGLKKHSNGCDEVQSFPTTPWPVSIDSPRHPQHAREM